MNPRYLWLLPLALLWPVLHTLVFVARFGRLPDGGMGETLVFLPMGILSGAVLLWFLGRARSRGRKVSTALGFLAACPFAFVGSLLGGLIFDPVIGTLIYGVLPLAAGAGLGYALGSRWDRHALAV